MRKRLSNGQKWFLRWVLSGQETPTQAISNCLPSILGLSKTVSDWMLFIRSVEFKSNSFWNFQKWQAVLCDILLKEKQEKVFCSNIATSLISGNHQGRMHEAKLPQSGLGHNFWLKCTSDLKLAFLNCILITLFRDTPLAHLSSHLTQSTWHLVIHLNLASGVSLKRAFKMQSRNAYLRSLVHSSQKLWPKPV